MLISIWWMSLKKVDFQLQCSLREAHGTDYSILHHERRNLSKFEGHRRTQTTHGNSRANPNLITAHFFLFSSPPFRYGERLGNAQKEKIFGFARLPLKEGWGLRACPLQYQKLIFPEFYW